MKETEKKLIIDLFKKIKNVELQTPNKDIEAEKLINFLLNNQNNAVYYMVQTILVQEIIIQELNDKIKKIENQTNNSISQSSSFLSDHLKNKILDMPIQNNSLYNNKYDTYKKFESNILDTNYLNNKNNYSGSNTSGGGISSFLGNALQTAVGVAGGMVAGNMITDFFQNHDKEHDISNHENNSDHIDTKDHIDNSIHNNFLNPDTSDDFNVDNNVHDDNSQDLNIDDIDDTNDFNDNF